MPNQSADGASTPIPPQWRRRRDEKKRHLTAARCTVQGKVIPAGDIIVVLKVLLVPGDRVVLEGDNQKQAGFLSCSLTKVSPRRLHDLHMITPSVNCAEYPDVFEADIAHELDFSFAGPQNLRVSQLLANGLLEVGAIHTCIELYAWLVVDLTPNVSLVAGSETDCDGNIYIGPSVEGTPTLAGSMAFSGGIVIIQISETVDDVADLPRVDVPGSWVDFIVQVDRLFYTELLFTHDPRLIKPVHMLVTTVVIHGIYQWRSAQSLNHGINFNAAAIELIPPTYGEHLGLEGKTCRNQTLNPHPTPIPAIESGQVENVYCFGTEPGMECHVATHPDVLFTDHDGSSRSNHMLCQLAGQYAVDFFIDATLQVNGNGHSSTVTRGRLVGFGDAPNTGHDPRGRYHTTPTQLDMTEPVAILERDEKFVVQTVETFQGDGKPTFVDTSDATAVARQNGMPLAPIMIHGGDIAHLPIEDDIACLYKARLLSKRYAMIAAVANITSISLQHDLSKIEQMCRDGLIALPEDFDVRRNDASRELPATKSIADLVEWSDGLYDPSARFQS